MNINQDKLSILQKQFEEAAKQFPEMVYYTAMLSVEDYKNHGHLTRNACFYEAENVLEVIKKKGDPWQIDFLGKEIHAWDDGRYDSPVIRDGPSNNYHWLVRPIGQSWDTLPAMQRIHTLTRQASIILEQLYGTIDGLSRIICQPSNYLSHWFISMRDILINEKHEHSFILEELEYLNKALYIALKEQNVELVQKLLSEKAPTVDGISDVFLKSAFVCAVLIERIKKKEADTLKVMEKGENIREETTPPAESVTQNLQKPAESEQIIKDSKTSKPQKNNRKTKLKIDEGGLAVRLNGKSYKITDRQKDFLKELLNKKGMWVSGKTLRKDIDERVDKIKNSLPSPVKKLIQSHTRDGYRLVLK